MSTGPVAGPEHTVVHHHKREEAGIPAVQAAAKGVEEARIQIKTKVTKT